MAPVRGWRVPTLASLVGWVFVVLGFAVGCRPLFDNSLFTHLATGRLIVESGIPRQDPYSFTAAGEPWVVQSWLVSAVYGVVERLVGINGVRVLAGLLVALLVALLWRLTRPARSLAARLVVLGLALVASATFWSPRPLLVGLVLLALTLVVVVEGRDPRWLVPIQWVWVNSHGSYPLGVLAVGCVCLGGFLDERRRSPRRDVAEAGSRPVGDGRRWWEPVAWMALGTVLGAVGPGGPALLLFPVHLLGRMEILHRVVEWQSPDFSAQFARVFLAQVVVAVMVLVRRPSYRAALPLVVFTAVALAGQRSIPNAAIVLVPGLAVGLEGLGRLEGRERRPAVAVAVVALTLVAAVGIGALLARPAFDLTTYPTDAIAWADQHGLLTADRRVATPDTVGNTLELLYGTRVRTFFDDRYDLFPLDLSRDYLEVHGAGPGWEDALDRHRVQYLLWNRSDPVTQLVAASPRWRILYQDREALVACRRGSGAPDC